MGSLSENESSPSLYSPIMRIFSLLEIWEKEFTLRLTFFNFLFIEIGIVLHTHGDQAVMLPDENVEALINVLKPDDDRTFSTDWIVRYAVVVKCRGVIKSKGYIAAIDALTSKE